MNQVQEPNFEGEEMKLPEMEESATISESTPAATSENAVSTPILIVLVVVLLAILGGLAYWYYLVTTTPIVIPTVITRPTADMNQEPESDTARARTDNMDVVSTSDEIDAIEADINSTNLDDLDTELDAIDAELDAALNAG